jgi:hypothetical protein
MAPTEGIIQYVPENITQADSLSTRLAKSSLIPKHLQGRPDDVLVTLITGHELGLSPMQAVRSMYVVGGKAAMGADMMVGLCLSRPVCKYFTLVESTDEIATYETHREGSPKPVRLSFTIAQAKAAGVTRNPTWTQYPAAMLRARASSALARAVYPDVLAGVYDSDSDELQQRREVAVNAPPVPVQAAVVEQVVNQLPEAAPTALPSPTAEVPPPVQSLAEQLAAQFAAAESVQALQAVSEVANAACRAGKVAVEDRARVLIPAYQARLSTLTKKAA